MQYIKSYINIILLFLFSLGVQAQSKKISITVVNSPAKEVFAQLQQKSGYRILFNDEVVNDALLVSATVKNETLDITLKQLLKNTELVPVFYNNNLIIITNKKFLEENSNIFGFVIDETNQPMSFANVALIAPEDSTKLHYSTVTDMKGNFELMGVKKGNYKMNISFVGYKSIVETQTITGDKKLSYQMKPNEKMLKEVTVKADEVRVSAEKSTYQIQKNDLQGKSNAMDLVDKIPQITIDHVNEKIKSTNGKSVKLLLNGISATEIDLKSIRPENVIKFEYYDFPPARYAEYGSVVNVITKTPENGLATGVNLNHVFTTGFCNDMIYIKYNKGRSQFALNYSLNYRDYSDREQNSIYDYTFKGDHYHRDEELRNRFGYEDNYVNFTYSNQKIDNYAFQIRFSPNYLHVHNDGNSEINYSENDIKNVRIGTSTSQYGVFSPSVDIYLSKQLANKQEIALNAVGTGFSTSNKYANKELNISDSLVLNDYMDQKNQKYSIIAELNYSKKFSFGKFNSGYSIEANRMNTNIDNSFGTSDYNTAFLQNYVYTDLSGQMNKWQYVASLGLSYRNRRSYSNHYDGWIFRPRFKFGYNFNTANNLKLVFERVNIEPSLGALSNNQVFVTDEIVRQGNPSLRNSIDNSLSLNYNFNNKYLNLNVTSYYRYTLFPQNSYFIEKQNHIVEASENGKNLKSYGVSYSATAKPLGNNLLLLRFQGQLYNTELNSSQVGYYSYLSKPLGYNVSLNMKNFTAYYEGRIVGYQLSGPYLNADENQGHFGAKYSKNSWSISASAMWLGTLSKYHT
jgi:hypothetical protein